jgi:RsiW-degrading membrane proteinase PrsW (M82 family)
MVLLLSQVQNTYRQQLIFFFVNIAIVEERIKHIIAYKNHHDYSITHSDIIIFGILAALSYAWRENILVATSITHALARTPVYLAHIIFSTIISVGIYLYFRHQLKKYTLLIAIAASIMLHAAYNIRHHNIGRPLLVVGGV